MAGTLSSSILLQKSTCACEFTFLESQAHFRAQNQIQSIYVTFMKYGCSFAGFGAAKHLAEQGYDVTLVDGSENPGGLSTGWRTPQGRAVEAGTKGFWYQVSTGKGTAGQTKEGKKRISTLSAL